MAIKLHPQQIDFSKYQDYLSFEHQVHEKSAFTQAVCDYFANRETGNIGDRLPWKKTDDKFGFRPKELTILAGVNGHGKSMMVNQLVLELLKQNRKCLILSLEMPVINTLARFVRQSTCALQPGSRHTHAFMQWKLDNLYLFDYTGSIDPERISKVCQFAKHELDIDYVIIDCLSKCVRGEDNYNDQKDFVTLLQDLCKGLNMHILLVHHVRKSNNEHHPASKWDLRGSASLSDLTDNLLLLHRNKAKEAEFHKDGGISYNRAIPDAILTVAKQRHHDWEGSIELWYWMNSQRYTGAPSDMPEPYCDLDALEAPLETSSPIMSLSP